jgi:hypothetical protein
MLENENIAEAILQWNEGNEEELHRKHVYYILWVSQQKRLK